MDVTTGLPLNFYTLLGFGAPDDLLFHRLRQVEESKEQLGVSDVKLTSELQPCADFEIDRRRAIEKYREKLEELDAVRVKLDEYMQLKTAGGDVRGAVIEKLEVRKVARERNLAEIARRLQMTENAEINRRRREAVRAKYPPVVPLDLAPGVDIDELLARQDQSLVVYGRLIRTVQTQMDAARHIIEENEAVIDAELRRAYKRAALKYHPDRNKDPSATEMFALLARAFQVLSDRDQRTLYNSIRNHNMYLLQYGGDASATVDSSHKMSDTGLLLEDALPPQMRTPFIEGQMNRGNLFIKWQTPRRAEFIVVEDVRDDRSKRELIGGMMLDGRPMEFMPLQGLKNGHHVFRVCGANAVGRGPWSLPIDLIVQGNTLVQPFSKEEIRARSAQHLSQLEVLRKAQRKRKAQRRKERRDEELLAGDGEDDDEDEGGRKGKKAKKDGQGLGKLFKLVRKGNCQQAAKLLATSAAPQPSKGKKNKQQAQSSEAVNLEEARDRQGRTLLAAAAESGDEEMVNVVLEHVPGIDPAATDRLGRTALIAACMVNSEGAVRAVLQLSPRVPLNHEDGDGMTALGWGLSLRNPSIVSALLRAGADPDLECADGELALSMAVDSGDAHMVRLLLDFGAALDPSAEYAKTKRAAETNAAGESTSAAAPTPGASAAAVRETSGHGSDGETEDISAGGSVTEDGVVEPPTVELRGGAPSLGSEHPVVRALLHGDNDMARELLTWRPTGKLRSAANTPMAGDQTPTSGREEKNGFPGSAAAAAPATVRPENEPARDGAMFVATALEDVAAMTMLLELGCPINVRNCEGNTPLHIAYSVYYGGGEREPVDLLLNWPGCDDTSPNESGVVAADMEALEDDSDDEEDEKEDMGDSEGEEGEGEEEGEFDGEPDWEELARRKRQSETDKERARQKSLVANLWRDEDMCSLGGIPIELLFEIFGYLPAAMLLQVARVSKVFKVVAMDDALWRPVYLQSYPLSKITANVRKGLPQAPPGADTWQRAFLKSLSGGHACLVCLKQYNIMQCSGCKGAYYCSVKHQKEHWAIHCQVCVAMRVKRATSAQKQKQQQTRVKSALKLFNSIGDE